MNKNSFITTASVTDFSIKYKLSNTGITIVIIRAKNDSNYLFGDIYKGSKWISSFVLTGGEYYLIDTCWWKDRRRKFTLGSSERTIIEAIKTGEVRPGINRQEAREFGFEVGFGDCLVITHLHKVALAWKRYKKSPGVTITKEARYL